MDKDSKSSKTLILEAATAIFAEKGYDGARVDEIAKRAQVNKALIYYYFESKDKILEELMVGLVNEMVDLKDQMDFELDKLDVKQFFDGPIGDDYMAQMFKYIKKNYLLLKIIMIESLKEDTNKSIFFQMLNLVMQEGLKRARQMNNEISDLTEFSVVSAFFFFIPMLNFIQFGERWAEYNELDYQVVQEKYFCFHKKISKDFLTNGNMA